MFYINELHFLYNTFKKSRVQVTFAAPKDPLSKIISDDSLTAVFNKTEFYNKPINNFLQVIDPHTIYKISDTFNLHYMFFILPEKEKENLLFIGPYIPSSPSSQVLLEIGEKNGISPKNQKIFDQYYLSIPVIPENSPLFTMLDVFCEKIWQTTEFSVIDINNEHLLPVSPINEVKDNDRLDDTLAHITLMEKRYNYENELMQTVSLGQIHKADLLFSSLTEMSFEQRGTDPLRSMKNYCIIMNTLLRKAAEKGGVRPIYLDKVSSEFAVQIEQIARLSEVFDLMKEIFRSYCRLVRKHSTKNYSPIVQHTIIFIESDLSANLTLSTLAAIQKVSSGYLSTVFKKETGKTVTEYIREKRMKHAENLLSTTQLQIQTIALHCGIMDVHYFSKMFKKHTGKTPKEYRETTNFPF